MCFGNVFCGFVDVFFGGFGLIFCVLVGLVGFGSVG